jgi:RHS repeat-associated protein
MGGANEGTSTGQTVYSYSATYDGVGNVKTYSDSVNGNWDMTGYIYDADGTRVAKGSISTLSCDLSTNGFQTQSDYILGASGEQMTEMTMDTDGSMYVAHNNVWAGGKLLATYDGDGALHFYLTDPLGSRRVMTNYAGVVEQNCSNLPFGDGENCGPTPTEHLFTGKERDSESGNDYFFARYYSSAMGRFLSPDWAAKAWPVPYAKLDDPQTLNLYGYLRNNPLGGVDADGHCGAGANDPPCQKQADNPASHVSAETKAQIKDAVAATKKPSGDDKKGGFHEEAGISYTQDGKQVQAPATPGAYKDVTTPGPATSDPYKTADPSKAKPGDVQADVDYHTHPNGTATTTSLNPSGQTVQTTSSFNQPPSAVDIQNASPAPTLNIVVGTGNNTVYFYTGAGTTCTESLKDFYKPQ